MDFLRPASWREALELRAERPDALAIAGGTDVMVALNFDRDRPAALLDLTRVDELRTWSHEEGPRPHVRLGAGVSYATVIDELGALLPGLAMASRSVGSPQIRSRGTVGGNLGSASPAGDALPPLLASGAVVEAESAARGARDIAIDDFFVGVKRHALAPDELVRAVRVPVAAGPQQYAKIGTRNAMVIAVASFGIALHPDRGEVGTGIGSAAPTPRRAPEAEDFAADALADLWATRGPLPAATTARFGALVAAAASPIDDVRGTAAYRRRALEVLARRTLTWTWDSYREAA